MNIFAKMLKRRRPPEAGRAEFLTGAAPVFTPMSGGAYANDIYRAAVDAIARNAAKLKGSHVVKADAGRNAGIPSLNRLLQVRPNPYMSAYDMIYRMVTHYFLYNNAFALLQRGGNGRLEAIFPIKAASAEFLADENGALYAKFTFANGKGHTFPYSDVVHLRRNYNDNDLLGDPNTALIPALELAHTQNEGIISAIKSGASIRGVLRFTQVMAPEKLKEEKELFINDYMRMSNNGGVVATDAKMEYAPIESKPHVIDDKQMREIREKIYNYLGVSEKIVNSSYGESEWGAFYESVIEPIAVQMSLEFTEKAFTQREQAFGNSIIFEANRLQFASAATKTALIKDLMPLGLLSVNEALEVLNMPGRPDGERRLVSLNFVNADKQDQYQLE